MSSNLRCSLYFPRTRRVGVRSSFHGTYRIFCSQEFFFVPASPLTPTDSLCHIPFRLQPVLHWGRTATILILYCLTIRVAFCHFPRVCSPRRPSCLLGEGGGGRVPSVFHANVMALVHSCMSNPPLFSPEIAFVYVRVRFLVNETCPSSFFSPRAFFSVQLTKNRHRCCRSVGKVRFGRYNVGSYIDARWWRRRQRRQRQWCRLRSFTFHVPLMGIPRTLRPT